MEKIKVDWMGRAFVGEIRRDLSKYSVDIKVNEKKKYPGNCAVVFDIKENGVHLLNVLSRIRDWKKNFGGSCATWEELKY